MKLGRIEKRKPRSRRSESVILFAVAQYKFAIAAHAVDEIRNLEGLQPLGQAFSRAGKVRHVFQRDHRTYFVVDANLHLRILSSHATRLLLLRDASIALTADSIDRMAQITTLHPLPHAFQGEERDWYRGLALIGEDVVPVVNPAALLSKAEIVKLQDSLPKLEAAAQVAGSR